MKLKVFFMLIYLTGGVIKTSAPVERKSQAQFMILNTFMTNYTNYLLGENELKNYWNFNNVKLKKIHPIKTYTNNSFDHYEPQMKIPYATYLKIKSTNNKPSILFSSCLVGGIGVGLWGGGVLGLLLDRRGSLALVPIFACLGACFGAVSGGTIGIIVGGISALSSYKHSKEIVAINTNWWGRPAIDDKNMVEVGLVGISHKLREFSEMLDQAAFRPRSVQTYQNFDEQPTNNIQREDFETID